MVRGFGVLCSAERVNGEPGQWLAYLLALLSSAEVTRVNAALSLLVVLAQNANPLHHLPEPVVVARAKQSELLEDAVEPERVEVGNVIAHKDGLVHVHCRLVIGAVDGVEEAADRHDAGDKQIGHIGAQVL